MFSRTSIKEAFTVTPENQIDFSGLTRFFTNTLPNPIVTSDPSSIDLKPITTTHGYLSRPLQFVSNDRFLTNPAGDTIQKRQSACEATGNGDQFDHLVSLSETQDPKSTPRCGWVYNTQTPSNGRGAYGSQDGPFNTSAKGTWMWNLNEAKEKFHKSICDPISSCNEIDASVYKGRCGWSTSSGKGIPIKNGSVAYPFNPLLSCSPESLVTSASSCPPPTQNSGGGQTSSPAGSCDPLPNGSLSRGCLIQKVIDSGCSSDGTLAYALKSGSDTNYTDILSQSKAYKLYQDRAVIGLDDTALRSGKITVAQALDQFKQVNDHASSTQNGSLEFASRDLCFKRGTIDTFDFCSELNPSTPGPFTLDCIQKAFLKAGGQKSGTMYPKQSDLVQWNRVAPRWGDVLNIIQSVMDRLRSTDRDKQEAAMREFYGITIETASKEPDGMKIVSASYGENCGGMHHGNQTAKVAGICDGTLECVFKHTWNNFAGDPAPGCPKDFRVQYKCPGSDHVRGFLTQKESGPYVKVSLNCNPNYAYNGCFVDTGNRALPTNIAIGDNRVKSVEECYNKAKNAGHKTFGLQYYGECWVGTNVSWDRYGALDPEKCGELGSAWNNQVYSIL